MEQEEEGERNDEAGRKPQSEVYGEHEEEYMTSYPYRINATEGT